MLDETSITDPPPLYHCYGRLGEQVSGLVTGEQHAKRILPGALNVKRGEVLLFITAVGNHPTHPIFLRMLRRHWRGWPLGRFEDRGVPHTAAASLRQAKALNIEVRFLPRATPELKAMDHLWRQVKGRGRANRATTSIDKAADDACHYLLAMSRRERLQKAGGLSGNFWLTK
jgi:hypothetical protein